MKRGGEVKGRLRRPFGDGSIIVPDTIRDKKGKLLYPKIKITFVKKDTQLANKLILVLESGTIESPNAKDYVNLLIQDTKTLLKLAFRGRNAAPKYHSGSDGRSPSWLN